MSDVRHRAGKMVDAVEKEAEAVVDAVRARLTLEWHEIEEWQRDNEYIVSGYRRAQNSLRGCMASVFSYLHNETVNIHSHMWGAVLFLALLCSLDARAGWADFGVAAVFLGAAVFCMGASAFYHAVGCHSDELATRCKGFDYGGIVALTVGSFYPVMYYTFFCAPRLQAVYLGAITIAGLGAAVVVLDPAYGKPSHRGARTKVFMGLGLSGAVPAAHAWAVHDGHHLFHELGFGYVLASGALYVLGALLYANRVPERFAPGKFDYFFASHQLFHLCVVLAAGAHYGFVRRAFGHWHGDGRC